MAKKRKTKSSSKKKNDDKRNYISPRAIGIAIGIIMVLLAIHLSISFATYSIDDFYIGESVFREVPNLEEYSKIGQFFQKINLIKRFRPPRPLLNKGGYIGALMAFPLMPTFGLLSFFIPILLLYWAVSIFRKTKFTKVLIKTLIVFGFWILLSALFGLPGAIYFVGDFGLSLAKQLKLLLGKVGAWAFTIAFFLSYIWLTIGAETLEPLLNKLKDKIQEKKEQHEKAKEIKRQEILKEHELRAKRRKEMLQKIKKIEDGPNRKTDYDPAETRKITEGFDDSRFGEKEIEIIRPGNKREPERKNEAEKAINQAEQEQNEEDNIGGTFSIDVKSFLNKRKKNKEKDDDLIIEEPEANDDEMEVMVTPDGISNEKKAKDYSSIIEPPKKKPRDENSIEDELENSIPMDDITPSKPGFSDTEEKSIKTSDSKIAKSDNALSEGVNKAKEIAQKSSTTPKEDKELIKEESEDKDSSQDVQYYFRPLKTDLLDEPDEWGFSIDEARVQEQSKLLEETLEHFKINGEITRVTPGPVITRFEYRPERGVKISKISNLADDLAMALKALNIRIIAPIPGKDVVGMEIPNDEKKTVYIKEILLSDEFRNSNAKLPIALGSAVDGSTVVADLAKAPHLLIAGATGSGKSVCVNTIITSLLYSHKPTSLRLMLIDPKRLELSIYNGIPFLLSDVVVEPKHSAEAFKWAVDEMTSRYRMLADVNVRNLADFNEKVKKHPEMEMEPLPRIVIVVDELADLMMTVSAQIEEPIARLAQMARAVGIHLVLATQRPSVDVLTGLIKANFPSRIAFKVRSQIDSRTIIDMGGAERLLGYGDMLFLNSSLAEPQRVHGSFVTTEETERIVKKLKAYPNPEDLQDFSITEDSIGPTGAIEMDELLPQGAKLVVINQKGSASMLQRKLRIGYNRAGSIIDSLEKLGIVGPPRGSKPREVLIKELEQLTDILSMKGF
ncbi:MAG: DNA translocase FtsK 4TM domain-containing protein [Candidatus Zixiibacteriota bacterium]